MTAHLWLSLFALGSTLACSVSAAPTSDPFAPGITTVRFEIDAMDGATPIGASASAVAEPWELLRVNVEALFEGSPRAVELPQDEGEIGPLADPGAGDYDTDALLALAEDHRDTTPSDEVALVHVLFVDGYYEEDGERNDAVLGVSIGDTGVIAMFAPVIGDGPLARFVEQTTIVHEFGHAGGLVDNGLDMVDDHLDAEHGHHCANDGCVMFWLNEGAADLREYVQQYVLSGDVVLFDDACLADAAAAQ